MTCADQSSSAYSSDSLVVPSRAGTPLRVHRFRQGHFLRAAVASGVPGLVPHELRHTAASLAIGSGATVTGGRSMLGHPSAAMTLDRYGHLLSGKPDAVADRLHEARADHVRTEPASSPVRRLPMVE